MSSTHIAYVRNKICQLTLPVLLHYRMECEQVQFVKVPIVELILS